MHKLVCVKLVEGLAAYPPAEACFSVTKIEIYISVVNQPLDCLYPITLNVRPSFNLFQLLLPIRHRTTNAADTVVALVVKLAMRNAVSVQELPHVALRLMDYGRDEYLVLATDTRYHLFLMLAPLVEGLFISLSLNRRGYFLALAPAYAFLLADADKSNLA